MRFSAEHHFPAPATAVMDILVDPSFHLGMHLADLVLAGILEHHDDGSEALLLLRYEYVGYLDPMALRLLGGRRLTWLQELALDRRSRSGRVAFAAEAYPQRLHGSADFFFTSAEHETVRQLEGELTLAVPLIARNAERKIVDGFLRRLDIESEFVTHRLQAG